MFSILDISIVVVLIFSAVISIFRGFIRELFSMVTWVLAIFIAWHFGRALAAVLTPYISREMLRLPIAYSSLFILTMILGGLLNYLFGQLVDRSGLSGTDRTLGLVFGLARGILIVAILLLVMRLSPAVHQTWWKDSKIAPLFQPLETWLSSFLPHDQPSNYALRNDTP